MKNALKWSITLIAVLFLVFCSGMMLGRRTNIITADPAAETNSAPTSQASVITSTDGKINLNTATAKDLQKLPGIGETLANRIIEYRNQNGPFRSIRELQLVNGIGAKTLENIIELIYVEDAQ